MKISITSSIDQVSSDAIDSIRMLLTSTLARFTPRIAQVSVLIADENGPKGGIDKLCRVNVQMPGLGMVTTTARHEKTMAAVSEAARRARRMVVTKLKRPQSLRNRQRTKSEATIDAEPVVTSE